MRKWINTTPGGIGTITGSAATRKLGETWPSLPRRHHKPCSVSACGYTLTSIGATSRSDQPASMRAWGHLRLREGTDRPFQTLTHAVRTGDNAFNHVFGTDVWTYRSHPGHECPRSAWNTGSANSAGSSTSAAVMVRSFCGSSNVTPKCGARSLSRRTSRHKPESASRLLALPPAAILSTVMH